VAEAPERAIAKNVKELAPAAAASGHREALGAAGIGTWSLDMETGIATWDSVCAELLGLGEDALQSPVLSPVHPDDRSAVAESLDRSFDSGCLHDVQFRPDLSEAGGRWLRSIAHPPEGARDTGQTMTGVLLDVTEHKQTEVALQESQRQLATLINNLPGIAYRCTVEAPWIMQFVSQAVEDITGYSAAEIYFEQIAWAQLMHPEDSERVATAVEQAIAEKRSLSIQYRIVARDGSVKWVHECGEATFDDAGTPQFLEGFIWDVTDQHAADDRLQWTASHDGLTKLPNRLLFQQRLDEALARAGGSGFVGVLLLDLDDFKLINDTLGHDAGDALLCAVAERLTLSVGSAGTVSRLSGDEFAIVVEGGADRRLIQRTATKIMASFEEPFVHQQRLFDCHGSLGISISPDNSSKRSALLKDADIALYAAKAEGGAKLKFYEPSMRNEMQNRSSMLLLARDALVNDWIVPHYQPKVDLASGQINGFEALLRWEHPTQGLHGPDTVAAAFQDLDLAASISDRMIGLVIADMQRWSAEGVPFGHVAINAAAAEFRRGNFGETLIERLNAAGLSPERMQVEVTETVFLGRGAEYVETALRFLNAAGVAIALDDFGTGYASLSHLKQFPVDCIKIDRSFIRDLHEDPDDEAIVRAVISLCKTLGIKIVAEGIETSAQAAYLRKYGCDFGQGFWFGAAIPCADVAGLLLANESPAPSRARR
jgi:diguanylate cyclase (GGDEF)-like protein/PAS domain S-box-containing protein